MFHVVLFEPEIPPNTGNLIRLSANTGCQLHLVKPLGFRLDRKSVRRAGLDYDELATVHVHDDYAAARLPVDAGAQRITAAIVEHAYQVAIGNAARSRVIGMHVEMRLALELAETGHVGERGIQEMARRGR